MAHKRDDDGPGPGRLAEPGAKYRRVSTAGRGGTVEGGEPDDAFARADVSLADARAALLSWFRAGHREMPWRGTRDPYAIWVSEVMLQQTRVETVIPYFERFLQRFPTVRALAAASVDDVLALWSGLGYYSRGRNVHRAAQVVVLAHRGEMPRTVDALLALPGVGRYTAGAIASIAFDQPAPILDGNVMRVMARLFAIVGDPKARASQALLWTLAARWAEAGPHPGDANQSLMELGATVCTPRSPRCDACPAASVCTAYARGAAERFPEMPARKKPLEVRAVAALITRSLSAPTASKVASPSASESALDVVEVLMIQRGERGLLAGLWDLPTLSLDESLSAACRDDPPGALADYLFGRLDVLAKTGERVARLTHVFTHRRLTLEVHRVTLRRALPDDVDAAVRWVRPSELPRLPLSRLAVRALTASGIAIPPDAASRSRLR